MFAITHRSIVFSAAALFTVLTSAAAAQNPEPASQSNVTAADDDGALVLAEPDFRVLNLPSTLRLPLHGSSFQLTHRFNGNLRQGSFNGNASNLFGLDQGAAVGFEYRFGIVRHLQAAVYRTAVNVPADRAAAILSNRAGHYFNVHTALNPDGAIRGQLSEGSFDPGTAVPY
jgi:hypothetical protein